MKNKTIKNFTLLILVLFTFIPQSADAQRISYTQNPSTLYNFQIDNLVPSDTGAILFHMWWFGDNGFSFLERPSHIFSNDATKKPAVFATEGYGTGGPPPLRVVDSISPTGTRNAARTLSSKKSIRIQNYRKAVIRDTVYLIVTYAQPTGSKGVANGTIEVTIDSDATVLNSFINDPINKDFFPNGETFTITNSIVTVDFFNLLDEERSILIPVFINPTSKEELIFNTTITIAGATLNKFEKFSEIRLPLRNSQDPNQMSEVSTTGSNSSGETSTPCKFGDNNIDYTIDFQNIGEGSTYYVEVICQLDDKVDLNSINNIVQPNKYRSIQEVLLPTMPGTDSANYYINDTNKTITFRFNDLVLYGTNDPLCKNLRLTQDRVSFSINAKPNYVFGPPIISYATIIFDENESIQTDTVFTSCDNPIKPGGFPAKGTSNPFIWILSSIVLLGVVAFAFLKRKK